MSELIEQTVELVEQFNDEIQSDLRTKGIDNTGQTAGSLRIESTKNSVKSIGSNILYFLDKGRGPGKFPPPAIIEEWVKTKPVDINPYLVGRKIAREGTAIYKDNSKGVQLDNKIEKLKVKIKEIIPVFVKADVLNQLKFK